MKGRREFIAGLGSAAALPGEFIGGLAALGAAGTSPVLWPHAALAQLRPVVGYLSPGAQANEAERLTVLRERHERSRSLHDERRPIYRSTPRRKALSSQISIAGLPMPVASALVAASRTA
jgi:hypothetical protein